MPSGPDPAPREARPMLATPSTTYPTGTGWAWELKWDGIRALALAQDAGLRMWTRNGNDISGRYPELDPLVGGLDGHDALLDGEVVTYDDQGRPSFERLQRRMHVTSVTEIARLAGEVPVEYLIFDLLWLDGHLTTALPYEDRRRLLRGPLPPPRPSRARRRRPRGLGGGGGTGRAPPREGGGGRETIDISKRFQL